MTNRVFRPMWLNHARRKNTCHLIGGYGLRIKSESRGMVRTRIARRTKNHGSPFFKNRIARRCSEKRNSIDRNREDTCGYSVTISRNTTGCPHRASVRCRTIRIVRAQKCRLARSPTLRSFLVPARTSASSRSSSSHGRVGSPRGRYISYSPRPNFASPRVYSHVLPC